MSGSVLLVDDDRSNLIVFEAAFGDVFPVLTAHDAASAFEILRANEVGVALADQRMPGMSGVDFLARVRREFPLVTRILITAYADLREAIDAINRGRIQGYLRKPWDTVELEARIREALESYVVRHELAMLRRRLVESERLYTLGVLSAGLVHELRSPLMVLGGSLDLIEKAIGCARDAAAGGAAPPRSRTLGDAQEQLGDARDALRRIRDIASAVGRRSQEPSGSHSADLAEALALALRHADPSLLRRATVEVDSQGATWVVGSTTQLSQIVLNLLTNALQAFADDGDPARQRIVLRVRSGDGGELLTVEDDGPGIPPDRQGEIFRPFFTTKGEDGTGLGLAIVRRIAEELGGEITVESEPGRGTRFTVRLVPARPPE